MTAVPDEDPEQGDELVAVLELSDVCVTAARDQDDETVWGLLAEAVSGDGDRFALLLRHWAYLLVDYCGDQMPGWAITCASASPWERATASERDVRLPAPGSHDEISGTGLVDTFLRGEGDAAKAHALNYLLRAGVDRNDDLMRAAVTAIGSWLTPDQSEIAELLLVLVAESLPRRSLPSHFTYVETVLFTAAEPDRREDMVLPLTRFVALQWAEQELGTAQLAVETVGLFGLDYPTSARRAAAVTVLSRALARDYAPGQPIVSTRADGRTVSDSSPLDSASPLAVDVIGCRMIALAAAGRAGDIPAELTRQTNGNDAQVFGVLLLLARRLTHTVDKGD